MLDIGQKAPEFRGEGSTIKGVVEGLQHNKIFVSHTGADYVALATANQVKYLSIMPFKRWKVVALGMYWIQASTANEDPIIDFGEADDPDAYGKMTSAITGGEKFNIGDFLAYDPFGILGKTVIAETSATLVVTWTEGTDFNKWNDTPQNFKAQEAAVAGMSSGAVKPIAVIEVDTGGKC
jgi:hypothetical protein